MLEVEVIFDAGDIDNWVINWSRTKIAREIFIATRMLKRTDKPEIIFYWKDKIKALLLAIEISEWWGKSPKKTYFPKYTIVHTPPPPAKEDYY